MNATESSAIRDLLLSERERIIAELRNHNGHSGPGDQWDLQDMEERAVRITSETISHRITEDDLNLLRKIDYALERLEHDTYETCDQCGAAIPMERLLAKPSASLCLACQEAKDALKF
jgi:DnaK suppressor protein